MDQQAKMDALTTEYYQRQNLSADAAKQYWEMIGTGPKYNPTLFWTPWMGFWFVVAWVLLAAAIFLFTVPL